MIANQRLFGDRATLAHYLARDIAAVLSQAVIARGRATLALSGGTTPALMLEALSKEPLPWSDIVATLVDERDVPETDARSNLRFLREHLTPPGLVIEPLAADALALLPLDVAVLGMGTDGHTASFFPEADRLHEALDPDQAPAIVAIRAPSVPETRHTFNLTALLGARHLVLHIEGAEKRSVLESAETRNLPVAAVLRAPKPLTLYWTA